MRITCPMCDGNSAVCNESDITLDCDWCGGRGWIDESENRFYTDDESEAESEDRASTDWRWVHSSTREVGRSASLTDFQNISRFTLVKLFKNLF